MVDEPISFAERRRRLLEERAREAGEVLPTPPAVAQPWEKDTLPDLHSSTRSDDEVQLDNIINNIDFATAYNKWIGKSVAVQTKKDGNMISCPFPNHPDKDPSAWFDDQGKWHCGGCEEGGDVYDLAAIHFGYPMPGYKDGQMFHKLREDMAASFGWRIQRVAGGSVLYQDAPPSLAPEPAQESSSPSDSIANPTADDIGLAPPPGVASPSEILGADEASNVAHMFAEDEGPEVVIYPTIAWQDIVPEDTFLYEYMKACSNDDSPEEYHFWHGLLALGHACGRKVTLDDSRPVYGNLMVCLLGSTGTGKSRSRGWLDFVLKQAVPYHEDGSSTTGTKIVAVPASGEYLVSAFCYEGKDPGSNNRSLGYQPVNGIVDFDEMSALLTRANREGSTLKPTIMGLADARDEVKIGSLTRGDYVAVQPYCSITASTQPRAIRTLLSRTDTGSGFLNRWIFAGGKEKVVEALGGSHSSTVIDLNEAVRLLKEIRGWGAMERHIRLEPDAYEYYVKYFHAMLEPTKRKDETDLLKRIDLISKKLMLLLTINLKRETVPVQVVEAVVGLMNYVIECFGILNSNIGITLMQDVMNEIQRHIMRHEQQTGRGASARDISRYVARKNYSLEQIKKALDTMCALDIIRLADKPPGPGRPTTRYVTVGEVG